MVDSIHPSKGQYYSCTINHERLNHFVTEVTSINDKLASLTERVASLEMCKKRLEERVSSLESYKNSMEEKVSVEEYNVKKLLLLSVILVLFWLILNY